MKLIEGMKDETLGSALLYNFSKGCQKPVDMKLFDVVLPLLYHDGFAKIISSCHSFDECLEACLQKEGDFKDTILKEIEMYQDITMKALGIAVVKQMLSFELFDDVLKGQSKPSQVMDFNEAIKLGQFLKDSSFEEVIDKIEQLGQQYEIVFLDSNTLGQDIDLTALNRFGKVEILQDIDPSDISKIIENKDIVITNKHILQKEQLKHAKKLKLICVTATGFNNIDIDYCRQNKIMVCNVKGYSTSSVGQHTFALLLDLYEKNHYYHDYVQSGNYSSSSLFTHFGHRFYELEGKTWGIVGMGEIGQKVAMLASAFGCHVQYYSTTGKNKQPYQQVDFETLCKTSDIISIHAPLNEHTKYLFDGHAFALMKQSAYLINVGRGPIVNEADLAFALKHHKIAGAGLDVFEQEPFEKNSPLLQINDPSVLLMTPHIAWATVEARKRVLDEVCLNIQAFIDGKIRNACI